MKNLRTSVLCVSIALFSLCTAAQENNKAIPINEPDYNKPSLFANLPGKIPVNINAISTILNSPVGSTVSITLSEELRFVLEGQVVSAASKYENTMQSVVIRSSNLNGATFTLTKVYSQDGSRSYTGRIVSLQHGDLYELQNLDGQFVLIKRKFYDLVNE
jgi:hypothetical protein